MAFLDKAALLTPSDLKRESISLGARGEVRMRELAVDERLATMERFKGADGDDPVQATLSMLAMVALALCNEDGSPMFPTTQEQEEAAAALLKLSSANVETMIQGCMRLNGMGKGAVKEAVGNSEETRSDSSSSGSAGTSDSPPSEASPGT